MQNITIGHVVFVLRRGGGRQGRHPLAAASGWHGRTNLCGRRSRHRRWSRGSNRGGWHNSLRRRIVAGQRREIEWRTGSTAAGSTNRRPAILKPLGRGDYCFVAERARCPWCVRLLRRVEHIRPATGRLRRISRPRWACLCRRCSSAAPSLVLDPIIRSVLQTLELHLKLLIPILQLLDGTGELTQCAFHAIEPDRKISRIGSPSRRRRLARLRVAAAEEIVQKISGPTLLRQRGTGQNQNGNCGKCRSSG